jgi:prepilin-type processing-associated H-X9-DG protein
LASSVGFPAYRGGGFSWFYGDFECTAYNHAQEPNGSIPDAIAMGGWSGIATARSIHPGGVNGLMADGAVRFVNQTISRGVWRALGTRNGDELVE